MTAERTGTFRQIKGEEDMQKITVEMNPEQIGKFRFYLCDRENAEATIRKYVTDIRTFFRYLGENRMVDKQSFWPIRNGCFSSMP